MVIESNESFFLIGELNESYAVKDDNLYTYFKFRKRQFIIDIS